MTVRIVATACFYCGKPVKQDTDQAQEAWVILLNGASAHLECVPKAEED